MKIGMMDYVCLKDVRAITGKGDSKVIVTFTKGKTYPGYKKDKSTWVFTTDQGVISEQGSATVNGHFKLAVKYQRMENNKKVYAKTNRKLADVIGKLGQETGVTIHMMVNELMLPGGAILVMNPKDYDEMARIIRNKETDEKENNS